MDEHTGPDSIDLALIGALCEELSAEREQQRLLKELQPDDEGEEQQ
jgi:hypothetical protein